MNVGILQRSLLGSLYVSDICLRFVNLHGRYSALRPYHNQEEAAMHGRNWLPALSPYRIDFSTLFLICHQTIDEIVFFYVDVGPFTLEILAPLFSIYRLRSPISETKQHVTCLYVLGNSSVVHLFNMTCTLNLLHLNIVVPEDCLYCRLV